MTKIKGLPVFDAQLDEKGMVRVSLVASPAVRKDFIAYSEQEPMTYSVEDEDRRLVYGVVMRANYPIYREQGGMGFFIRHSPELIRQMAERYLVNGYQNNMDTDHNGVDEEGCHLVQFFIKDTEKGVDPKGFEEIEDGSLFGEWHITNDEVWAKVKAGEFRGFSIEVYEDAVETDAVVSEEKVDRDVLEWLDKLKAGYYSQTDMAIFEKIKAALAEQVAEEAASTYGSVNTDNGILSWAGDEDLKEGDAVMVADENDEKSAAPDGDYKTEDGHVISVADGVVKSIEAPEEEVQDVIDEEVEAEDEGGGEAEGGEGEGGDGEAEAEEEPKSEQMPAGLSKEEVNEMIDKALEPIIRRLDALEEKVKAYGEVSLGKNAHDTYKAKRSSSFDEVAFTNAMNAVRRK